MKAAFLSAMAAASGSGTPALALPTLATAVVSDTANTTTLVTASFAVATGDFLMVAAFSRDSGSGTHAMGASGFTCDLSTVRATGEGTPGTNYIRSSIFYNTVTAGGTGTLTLTASQAQFQQALIVVKWAGGGRTIDQVKAGATNSGTTLVVTPDSTPNAGAASIFFYAQESTTDTPALSGHTDDISASGTVSDLEFAYFSKLGSPPANWTVTGITDGRARAGCGVTVL